MPTSAVPSNPLLAPKPAPDVGARGSMDVLFAMALVVVGAVAATTMADRSAGRLVLTLPVLFFAPGYLIIQSLLVPARPWGQRALHALVAVGVSPAVVGLLALLAAILPGGFHATTIVATITIVSLAFGTLALVRRSGRLPDLGALVRRRARAA